MNNVQKFLRRVKGGGGTFKVLWGEEDLYRLGKIYGLDERQVNKALAGTTIVAQPHARNLRSASRQLSCLRGGTTLAQMADPTELMMWSMLQA